MASKLQITGGEVLIDDDLLPILAVCNWHVMVNGNRTHRYARRRAPRGHYLGVKSTWVYMHRAIAGVVNMPDVVIDHVNGDSLDNRRCNLRITTSEQNLQEFSRRKYMGDHPKSKITDYDIPRVLLLRAQGHTFRAIAKEMGVSTQLIRNICDGIRGKGSQAKPPALGQRSVDIRVRSERTSDR